MEIRKSIESNFLTCKICFKSLCEPKVLSCRHTFCKPCLEKLLETDKLDAAKKRRELERQHFIGNTASLNSQSNYSERWSTTSASPFKNKVSASAYAAKKYGNHRLSEDDIQCPECGKVTVLPATGVHGLPNNLVLDQLGNMVGRIPDYPVCEICSSDFISDSSAPCKPNLHFSRQVFSDDEEARTIEIHKPGTNGVRRLGSAFHEDNIRANLDILHTGSKLKKVRGGPEEATHICVECNKRLCIRCQKSHLKSSISADHIILPVTEISNIACSKHKNELRRFFCVNCLELICLVCMFEIHKIEDNSRCDEETANFWSHGEHEVLSIHKGLEVTRKSIGTLSKECSKQSGHLETLLNGMRACKNYVDEMRSEICSTADTFVEAILAQKARMLNELDSDLGVNLSSLSSQCEGMHNTIKEWKNVPQFTDDYSLPQNPCPIKAIADASKLTNTLRNFVSKFEEAIPRSEGWSILISQITCLTKKLLASSLEITSECDVNEFKQQFENNIPPSSQEENISEAQNASVSSPLFSSFWIRKFGQFFPGIGVNLGQRVIKTTLDGSLCQFPRISRAVQSTASELGGNFSSKIRDTHRHRAVQVNVLSSQSSTAFVQTEPFPGLKFLIGPEKCDASTQCHNLDIRPVTILFRKSSPIVEKELFISKDDKS